jgi:hypothetical protein
MLLLFSTLPVGVAAAVALDTVALKIGPAEVPE